MRFLRSASESPLFAEQALIPARWVYIVEVAPERKANPQAGPSQLRCGGVRAGGRTPAAAPAAPRLSGRVIRIFRVWFLPVSWMHIAEQLCQCFTAPCL